MRKARLDYRVLYAPVQGHKEPNSYEELAASANYPHLNTKEFRLKPSKCEVSLFSCYDHVQVDENGVVTIACNQRSGRWWYGCIFAFDSFEGLVAANEELAVYKLMGGAHYTGLKLVQKNLMVLTQNDGTVQLFSLRCETRSTARFNLFEIGNFL